MEIYVDGVPQVVTVKEIGPRDRKSSSSDRFTRFASAIPQKEEVRYASIGFSCYPECAPRHLYAEEFCASFVNFRGLMGSVYVFDCSLDSTAVLGMSLLGSDVLLSLEADLTNPNLSLVVTR